MLLAKVKLFNNIFFSDTLGRCVGKHTALFVLMPKGGFYKIAL